MKGQRTRFLRWRLTGGTRRSPSIQSFRASLNELLNSPFVVQNRHVKGAIAKLHELLIEIEGETDRNRIFGKSVDAGVEWAALWDAIQSQPPPRKKWPVTGVLKQIAQELRVKHPNEKIQHLAALLKEEYKKRTGRKLNKNTDTLEKSWARLLKKAPQ